MTNIMHFHSLANPARFEKLARALLPICTLMALALLGLGLYLALMASPIDYQQGQTVRIMYLHVPMAWLALAIYGAMALAAATALIWRHPLADLFCRAAGPVGTVATGLCLITGSLWGKPMWGAWWVWDARLTSVLILFLLYLGYLLLTRSAQDPARGDRMGGILLLIGAVNLPIIRFSVDWWATLHQPASILRRGGVAIDPAMLWPLLIMAAALSMGAAALVLWRMLILLRQRQLAARRLRQQLDAA